MFSKVSQLLKKQGHHNLVVLVPKRYIREGNGFILEMFVLSQENIQVILENVALSHEPANGRVQQVGPAGTRVN